MFRREFLSLPIFAFFAKPKTKNVVRYNKALSMAAARQMRQQLHRMELRRTMK